MLLPDQFAGSVVESPLAVATIQGQSVDQRIGGGADLAESDLWIFPPGAAGSRGPGTNG